LSGNKITERLEVQNNLTAHKEFLRLSAIFSKIEKDDDIYSAVLNRYCLLSAECEELEMLKKDVDSIELRIKLDDKIMAKRKMMFDTEKENIMTIASALRSIPKKEEKKSNALMEALGNG
jgi:hypothetical protein